MWEGLRAKELRAEPRQPGWQGHCQGPGSGHVHMWKERQGVGPALGFSSSFKLHDKKPGSHTSQRHSQAGELHSTYLLVIHDCPGSPRDHTPWTSIACGPCAQPALHHWFPSQWLLLFCFCSRFLIFLISLQTVFLLVRVYFCPVSFSF